MRSSFVLYESAFSENVLEFCQQTYPVFIILTEWDDW